jgi:hypothetical protein
VVRMCQRAPRMVCRHAPMWRGRRDVAVATEEEPR